jgi:hypothetical protein
MYSFHIGTLQSAMNKDDRLLPAVIRSIKDNPRLADTIGAAFGIMQVHFS